MSEEIPQILSSIKAVIGDVGIEKYQDSVPDMGLEFLTRYLTDLIGDVVVFSEHAGNQQPTLNDVKMAIKMRHRTTTSTSKDQLRERVNACNTSKLPRNFTASIELPKPQEDTFTLLQRNYRVKTNEDFDDDDDDTKQPQASELPSLPLPY
ncbi:hypothetical protein EIN_405100 [Entamoeba invadens IP1]|uniref:Transcription initiation factor TFIID subunit n=1 Tax=Entamoeba invadens IP1 TaxID=370355 RepID=A0A0A1UAA1_ENTIV|nr:hypothetical protein EIN_405100 [Entamoeba invadens IP1]ELP90096.1 hypothetical protein EIN_405100 [Entamoeba invadens IP1]|eukprot:XP_004256867.1 hypothetical protein EIN_405100 [Entamoeba invadens IP1]